MACCTEVAQHTSRGKLLREHMGRPNTPTRGSACLVFGRGLIQIEVPAVATQCRQPQTQVRHSYLLQEGLPWR